MTRETTCPECGRTVGVVTAPQLGDTPRYKVSPHASTPRRHPGPRPRCIGSGIEPHPADVHTTTRAWRDRQIAEEKAP